MTDTQALTAERDALAVKVRRLEAALATATSDLRLMADRARVVGGTDGQDHGDPAAVYEEGWEAGANYALASSRQRKTDGLPDPPENPYRRAPGAVAAAPPGDDFESYYGLLRDHIIATLDVRDGEDAEVALLMDAVTRAAAPPGDEEAANQLRDVVGGLSGEWDPETLSSWCVSIVDHLRRAGWAKHQYTAVNDPWSVLVDWNDAEWAAGWASTLNVIDGGAIAERFRCAIAAARTGAHAAPPGWQPSPLLERALRLLCDDQRWTPEQCDEDDRARAASLVGAYLDGGWPFKPRPPATDRQGDTKATEEERERQHRRVTAEDADPDAIDEITNLAEVALGALTTREHTPREVADARDAVERLEVYARTRPPTGHEDEAAVERAAQALYHLNDNGLDRQWDDTGGLAVLTRDIYRDRARAALAAARGPRPVEDEAAVERAGEPVSVVTVCGPPVGCTCPAVAWTCICGAREARTSNPTEETR